MAVKINIALISSDTKITARANTIAETFGYTIQKLEPDYDFTSSQVGFRLILVGGAPFSNGGEFAAMLKIMRKSLPLSYILYIETTSDIDNASGIARTNGADLAMTVTEFFDTSKPDFIISQVVRATFLPIKSTDIIVGKPIDFDIYHLLPLREKFLKFCFKGDAIDEKRSEKLKSVNELYVHRHDIEAYAKYVNASSDSSVNGLNRRCRSQFLALYSQYMELALTLTDQSEKSSFETGNALFTKVQDHTMTLMNILALHPNPWLIINSSIIGDFGSIERSPAICAYAGILAIKMELAAVDEIMVVALMSELGILFLNRKVTMQLRIGNYDKLSDEDQKDYQKYPLKSISLALDKKIQLSEKFREISLNVHERADKTGFPRKRPGHHIPVEAFVIHFAHELDHLTAVHMGAKRIGLFEAMRHIINTELKSASHFTVEFLARMKKILATEMDPNYNPTA